MCKHCKQKAIISHTSRLQKNCWKEPKVWIINQAKPLITVMKPQLINTEKAAGLPETMKPPPLGGEIGGYFCPEKTIAEAVLCQRQKLPQTYIFQICICHKDRGQDRNVFCKRSFSGASTGDVLWVFSSFLIQVRNKVIGLLLNSVLCFNNCTIVSVLTRMSIVSRPQRLSCPQQCCPDPPRVVWQQTLLTTTTSNSEGDKQKQTHGKGVGHICIFCKTQRGVNL